MEKRKYDSTVARIAGNLLSGIRPGDFAGDAFADIEAVKFAVAMARAIVAEVQRTEPSDHP